MESQSNSTAANPAAVTAAAAAPRGRATRKAAADYSLHPLHIWAIKYVIFMLEDPEKLATINQFVAGAVAQLLKRLQKQGIEFPPKKLAELVALGLIK